MLSCNFRQSDTTKSNLRYTLDDYKQVGISYHNVIELFHEFGHSVHSLASKCEFQAFSGTRVPLDLAEVPSHLFEKFILDYDYVSQWANHKKNAEKLPAELFLYMSESTTIFKAVKNHMQLSFSLFDMLIHSEDNLDLAIEKFGRSYEVKELNGD